MKFREIRALRGACVLAIAVATVVPFMVTQGAWASGSVAISTKQVAAPAVDLVYKGRVIDRDEAIDLSRKGQDLSRLNPEASDIWQDRVLDWSDDAEHGYPADGATLEYNNTVSSSSLIFRANVGLLGKASDPNAKPYQMILSLNSHAALTRAAILRHLGYPIASPRWYPSVTIHFKDASSRDSFLDTLGDRTLTAKLRWVANSEVLQKPGEKAADYSARTAAMLDVSLRDVVLEPAQIDMPQYHWSAISSKHINGRRALRALLVIGSMFDINEAPNLMSWEAGKRVGDTVVLNHPYADAFSETSYDDVRWILRRIAAISSADLGQAVARGKYPQDVAQLILQKVIARRNHMLELFNLDKEQPKLKYDAHITVGAVKGGQLTQDHYDGYALEFMAEKLKTPLSKDEILRFFKIEGLYSAGLPKLVEEVNKLIDVRNVQDLATQHQRDLFAQFIKHLHDHPNEPYSVPVAAWGGLVGGPRVNWSRNVVSGTYYGGEAKVQLVDSFSSQVAVGAFMSLDGLPKVAPGLSANAVVQRNYIHVRPVPDMKTALKAKIEDLLVVNSMRKLGNLLDTSAIDADPDLTDAQKLAKSDENVKKFLDDLKEGEMFYVTDALLLGAKVQATIPLLPLMQVDVIGISPDITVAVGGSAAVMRRTTFSRTSSGIQVYVQSMDTRSAQFQLDFNWWINVFRWQSERKKGVAVTQAYILPEPTQEESLTADGQKIRRRIGLAVRGVLKANDTELLEESYPGYQLEHETTAKINREKFLRWSWYGLDESHIVKIQPPADWDDKTGAPSKDPRYNPKDKERTLFSNRIVHSEGTNDYAFLHEIIDKLAPGYGDGADKGGDYPSNYFLGRGRWKSVITEAEITPGVSENPVTLIEHHWGGWTLSKKSLFQILDQVEATVKPLNLDQPVIRRDEFAAMDKLQLYEILSTLVIYQDGQNRLRQLLFPDGGVKAAFNTLVDLDGRDEYVKWCRSQGRGLEYAGGADVSASEVMKDPLAYLTYENNKQISFPCVKPWIKDLLWARADYHAKDSTEKRMKWNSQAMDKFEKGVALPKLLTIVGKENYFFQLKVSGFRTQDENGDSEIVSDALGTFKNKEGAGVFRELASRTGLQAFELYARYLSEGY